MSDPVKSLGGEGDESSQTTRNVVIFVDAWDSHSIAEHIEAVADAFPHWRISVVQQFPKRRIGRRVRRKLELLSKDPLSFTVQSLGYLARKLMKSPAPVRRSITPPPPLSAMGRPNVRYHRVTWLHSKSSQELVRSLRPWLGLSIGAPILRKSIFDVPELGTINIHKSLLPKYRGMPYGFWELRDDETESGVTTHWVDEGLDTGPVIEKCPVEIPKYSTIRGLALELDAKATEVLLKTLGDLDRGNPPVRGPATDPQDSVANRLPTWSQAWKLHRKLWSRRVPDTSAKAKIRNGLKQVACFFYVHVYAAVRNFIQSRIGNCRVTILLYHRVNDNFLDSVTVGVEQFERQLKMVSRHYDIIDMTEFLASRARPRYRPALVLTFDDGYRDNYFAAMLLRRAGLPCTFFVSTQIVGTDRAFPHDLKALGYGVPTMSWDQIRKLREWGFRVSNHTRNHADLGSVGVEAALAEVSGAREDLERELGPIPELSWIAYPYGQPEHMDENVRRELPRLGIDFCFSAYGGSNPIDFDSLDIRRQNVDHRFTEARLRAAIEGWRA